MSTKTERKPVFRRASSSSLGSQNGEQESLLETSAAPSRSSSRPMTPSAPPLQHTKSEPARRASAPTKSEPGKLRQAAQRIQLIRNLSSTAHMKTLHGPHHDHSEPGLDAKKMDLDDEDEGEDVDVVTCDISSERFEKYTRSGNGAFQDFLNEERPKWSKMRWIHIVCSSGSLLVHLADSDLVQNGM